MPSCRRGKLRVIVYYWSICKYTVYIQCTVKVHSSFILVGEGGLKCIFFMGILKNFYNPKFNTASSAASQILLFLENAGIGSRTVATLALSVRRFYYSRLDLIRVEYVLVAISHYDEGSLSKFFSGAFNSVQSEIIFFNCIPFL